MVLSCGRALSIHLYYYYYYYYYYYDGLQQAGTLRVGNRLMIIQHVLVYSANIW